MPPHCHYELPQILMPYPRRHPKVCSISRSARYDDPQGEARISTASSNPDKHKGDSNCVQEIQLEQVSVPEAVAQGKTEEGNQDFGDHGAISSGSENVSPTDSQPSQRDRFSAQDE